MRATAFWARVEQHRKRAIALLAFLGPALFLRILTRTVALPRAAAIAGGRLDLRLKAVLLEHPEAAIDVDKPDDLRLVEQILSERRGQREAVAERMAAVSGRSALQKQGEAGAAPAEMQPSAGILPTALSLRRNAARLHYLPGNCPEAARVALSGARQRSEPT